MKRSALMLQMIKDKESDEPPDETNEKENVPSNLPPEGGPDTPAMVSENNGQTPSNVVPCQEICGESASTTTSAVQPRSRSSSTSSSSSSSSSDSTSSSSSSTNEDENAAAPGNSKERPKKGNQNSCTRSLTNPDESSPSTSKLRQQTGNRSYAQSPINPIESDVDLGDSDPTYQGVNTNQRRRRSPSASSSSSTDDSIHPEISKSRKRKRNPSKWKQNESKILRNSGKTFTSLSKSKKVVPARHMKETCTSKSRLKCFDNITQAERSQLFKSYWDVSDLELQRAYIRACMMEVQPRYRYSNAQKPRLPNNAFYSTVVILIFPGRGSLK